VVAAVETLDGLDEMSDLTLIRNADTWTLVAPNGHYATLHLPTVWEGYAFAGYSFQAVVIGRDHITPELAQPLLVLKSEAELDHLIEILTSLKAMTAKDQMKGAAHGQG
jgi:hypothetical protein